MGIRRGKRRGSNATDARQKAEHLASLHGVRIGPVLEINERGGEGQTPLVKAVAIDARSIPISAGVHRLSAKIRVVYQLQ